MRKDDGLLSQPSGSPQALTGHTPGPWMWTNGDEPVDIATYNAPGYYRNVELHGAEGRFVIGCDEYDILSDLDGQRVANARLIAAAPDQHETLCFVASDPCFSLLGSVTQDAVHAAIRKATEG